MYRLTQLLFVFAFSLVALGGYFFHTQFSFSGEGEFGSASCADTMDNDGDELTDCEDTDCSGTAACGATDQCGDGIDNDEDEATDCGDTDDCSWYFECGGSETSCGNSVDDDGDGNTDCGDTDCNAMPECEQPPSESCNNGIDDDGDNDVDCNDSDCSGDPSCMVTQEQCTNGIDDDGDAETDCNDADCSTDPACVVSELCTNAIDDDGDNDVDCGDSDCSSDPVCMPDPESQCSDGLDNDTDGNVDCNDSDCSSDPACIVDSTAPAILSFSASPAEYGPGDAITISANFDEGIGSGSRMRVELSNGIFTDLTNPNGSSLDGTYTVSDPAEESETVTDLTVSSISTDFTYTYVCDTTNPTCESSYSVPVINLSGVSVDTTPPTPASGSVDGNQNILTLDFDDTLQSGSFGAGNLNNLSVTGDGASCEGNSLISISGVRIILNILCSTNILPGMNTAVNFSASTLWLQDTAGNFAESFNDFLVTNTTLEETEAPTLNSNITDDTGSSTSDGITSDTTVEFGGIATEDSDISIFRNGTFFAAVSSYVADDPWSYTTPQLSNGTYTFTARAKASGKATSTPSSSVTVTVDTTDPSAPGTPDLTAGTDTGASATDNLTNDTTPNFTVSCESNAHVVLNTEGATIGTGTCSSGTITITSSVLASGSHVVRAAQEDRAGNFSVDSSTLTITVDTTAPTLSLASASTSPVTGAFIVTAVASEDINGLASGDVSVTNGSVSGFSSTNDQNYSFLVTPTSAGTVTVDIAIGSYEDDAGNANSAASSLSRTYTVPDNAASDDYNNGGSGFQRRNPPSDDSDEVYLRGDDDSSTAPSGDTDKKPSVSDDEGPVVLPFVCEPLLTKSITVNGFNDSAEVIKLQAFLAGLMKEELDLDGIYGTDDIEAVKKFQVAYADEILVPVGLSSPTGNVSEATLKVINRLNCAEKQEEKTFCPYFTESHFLGDRGGEILAIKIFLNFIEGEFLDITTNLFDQGLFEAVKRFQLKYADRILKPWNLTEPTGQWLVLSRQQANDMLGCYEDASLPGGKIVPAAGPRF